MKVQRILSMWTAILAIVITQFGCEKKQEHHNDGEKEGAHETHGHHEHTAPHGGTLVVLGQEFAHVEFVLENALGKLTAYVLDGEAEKTVRLTQKAIELNIHREDKDDEFDLQLLGVANVLTGETEGDTSEFAGQSEALKGAEKFHVEIVSITVKGQTFSDIDFEFPQGNEGEDAHDEHDTH